MIRIELPVGPTDNRRLIPVRGRLISSAEYRKWKKECVALIARQLPKRFKPLDPSYTDQLFYSVECHLPDKRTDAANYDKVLRDVLTEAGIWTDDKWCLPRYERVTVDKDDPHLVVTI